MAARQVANVAKSGVPQKLAIAESFVGANKVAVQGYSGGYSSNSPYGYSSSSPSGFGNSLLYKLKL